MDIKTSDGGVLFSGEGTLSEVVTAAVRAGANLCGANLYRAYAQPGKIRAYKLVTADGEGPFNGGITYAVGQKYAVEYADTDETVACGAGINLATMDWCLREWRDSYRVMVIEFTASDIAAIPIGTDGKFRLHRCTVVAEKDISALVPSKEEPCKTV